jgi:hypothetical protein
MDKSSRKHGTAPAIGLNKAKPEKSDLATFLATFKNSTTQRFLRI